MTGPPNTHAGHASYSTHVTAGNSGMNEDEARGFHGAFIMSFLGFTLIAAVAHYAVWQWRPWIPGVNGYEVRTTQSAPAVPQTVATNVQR